MKKAKCEKFLSFARRITLVQALFLVLITYLLIITFGAPVIFKSRLVRREPRMKLPREERIRRRAYTLNTNVISGLVFDDKTFESKMRRKNEFSLLQRSAKQAWIIGKGLWEDIQSGKIRPGTDKEMINGTENACPDSITLSGMRFKDGPIVIPCGLIVGSHVTVVGRSEWAHLEHNEDQEEEEQEEDLLLVSQFRIELQGLKVVDGEDPPRILHFNPRLKGDWSGAPVIEVNTCYRMQWGWPHRCEGFESRADEETVDGHKKCEKWIREDEEDLSQGSKNTWWLNRLIGKPKKQKQPVVNWPFPFTENKIFVLTISAGLEGYHISVDGRHVTSFPYRTGFALEDATGLSVSGDVDVHFVLVGSLPATHPSFAPQRHLEMLDMWRAPPLPNRTVELFIGIISAGNHFAERMAVRKSWMQHSLIRSSNVVARFFLALHGRMEINLELQKEADYFGDIVIVPYIDNYDLVVLKTVAICEFGVRSLAARYIMKCDDDTFVRLDAVINDARRVDQGNSFYLGNMNYNHKPMRNGKWAVTFEEWPEEGYPPYANGPGYILSFDIAHFIVSEFERHKLRLFKMEDVSMGIWVELFNATSPVEYVHDERFCQFGCIENYLTAHYQSPKQMICMWDKLQNLGKAHCCDMR